MHQCDQIVRREHVGRAINLWRLVCPHGHDWHVTEPADKDYEERPVPPRLGLATKRREGERRIAAALALVQENGMPKALPWRLTRRRERRG